MADKETAIQTGGLEIAVIGMNCRFPGAANVEAFWNLLRDGVEAIRFFSAQEMDALGVDRALLDDPRYVNAASVLDDVDQFDASFFGFSPREAELMDPQHRIFLECAWETLDSAGYNSRADGQGIGVFAGVSSPTYMIFNVLPNLGEDPSRDISQIWLGNGGDFLTTRVSYKLNLTGPSYTVQSACSTSLVAVHLACQSLLAGECRMALGGGVAVNSMQGKGYFYQEGGIASPDGHCRAFDAEAQGTIGGSGIGIVLLKRLEDALADGDQVLAVIKGSAINNDGVGKVSYTAPSVKGQGKVIAEALAVAGVEPESISYVEAHGTGTALGDPIEIAALTNAYRARTQKKGFCAIGAVKTNFGHLDTAAGVAGLIKTVLALQHKTLPPSLHFNQPNPQIDFDGSPFYVNTQAVEWRRPDGWPRRAGVSSFGIGGTNVHLILEEAPAIRSDAASRPAQLLLLSAKTESALAESTARLADHLKTRRDINLPDAAYALQVGRRVFAHRRAVVCRQPSDAVEALEKLDAGRVFSGFQDAENRPLVFMFPGVGTQYVYMGRDLYQAERTFREQVDLCSALLREHLGDDLKRFLYPPEAEAGEMSEQLARPSIGMPAIFVIEYATAKLLLEWGLHPKAMIGHSLGEYTAACLAGVLSLEDALALVALRGRLLELTPPGATLGVSLSESQLRPLIGEQLSLAAVNAPSQCVVSGPVAAVERLAASLAEKGFDAHLLQTKFAAHSKMVEPILPEFEKFVARLKLHPPAIPYISTTLVKWIEAAEATDPHYWARHLRLPVRFGEGIQLLMQEPERVFLEVGPGRTLSTLTKLQVTQQQQASAPDVLTSMRHPFERQSDVDYILKTLGRMWVAGVRIDWDGFYKHERRRRETLPAYPFERQRYWLEPRPKRAVEDARQASLHKKADIADWFYVPSWKRSVSPAPFNGGRSSKLEKRWLVFDDGSEFCARLTERLREEKLQVVTVSIGEDYSRPGENRYSINPRRAEDYDSLILSLLEREMTPDAVLHLWNVSESVGARDRAVEFFEECQERGYHSLLRLARAFSLHAEHKKIRLCVVASLAQEVVGEESWYPEKATLLAPCKVIPQECPNLTCLYLDIAVPESARRQAALVDSVLAELSLSSSDTIVAYRHGQRWVQTFVEMPLREEDEAAAELRRGGVYLITGGLGKVGLMIAKYLAQTVQARLILLSRSALPERAEWETWQRAHASSDPRSRVIDKLIEIEAAGGEVVTLSADVSVEPEMRRAVESIYRRYGRLDGLFHLASSPGETLFHLITDITPGDSEMLFRPKTLGLFTLEKVLQDKQLDFRLLFSSNAAILGGLGSVAYAAANLFMDAFALHRNGEGERIWTSANWDGWIAVEDAERQVKRSSTDEFRMLPHESTEALRRLIHLSTAGQVIVSTGDLHARLNLFTRTPARDRSAEPEGNKERLYQRPQLQNDYVPPRNETEQSLVGIWQDMLGVEQIGVHDNFFELGGHSLLAISFLSTLRKQFQLEIPLRKLFDAPTISELGQIIAEEKVNQSHVNLDAPQILPAKSKTIDELLLEIEQMSVDSV